MTFGYCMEGHPLQFPTTILVSGVMLALGGVVLRAREKQVLEQQRLQREETRRLAAQGSVQAADSGRGAARRAPSEIEMDEPLDLEGMETEPGGSDDDGESAMAFLQRERESRALQLAEKRRGGRSDGRDYYVPPGMERAADLFVDPDAENGDDVEPSKRIDSRDHPHTDLDEALRHAFQIVMDDNRAVVVRLMPGIYQTSVEIPSRVALVNHAMPRDQTVDERLAWLQEQTDYEHPQRVTLLAADGADVAVRFVAGENQGIFGCVLTGRSGVAQTGLVARDNDALAVVHCGFERFLAGGTKVVDSGEDVAGRRVQFVGCVWDGNTTPRRGAALQIRRSVVRIEAGVFENNRAVCGGAIAAWELEKPLRIHRSLIQRNRAQPTEGERSLKSVPPDGWAEVGGVGGGLWIRDGLAKLEDVNIEGNDASLGGGGIASVGARVVVESTGPERGVIRENRAEAGGGLLVAAGPQAEALIRVTEVEIGKNLSRALGGGACGIGNAVLQFKDVQLEANRATGAAPGIGGGIGLWRGAVAQLKGGEVTGNDADGGGGGIGAVNASVQLRKQCLINRNESRADGGGIYAVVMPSRVFEQFIGEPGFELPLEVVIKNVRITSNEARGTGGGLRAGSRGEERAFSLRLAVEPTSWIRGNSGGDEREYCDQLWVEWGGDLVFNEECRDRIEEVLT